jgi:hypothetical protein
MNTNAFRWLAFFFLVLLPVSLACGAVAPAAPAALPTSTAVAATATAAATLKPTSTPRPTSTPNLAATQQADARQTVLKKYQDAGYISSTSGDIVELNDFHQEWAQMRWYQWWTIDTSPVAYGDLVFHANFKWATASGTPEDSGCGIVFGIQPDGQNYSIFVDKGRILYMMTKGGSRAYEVGKTSGSGRLHIEEPYNADVGVIVNGYKSYVIVNDVVTQYSLSKDRTTTGDFALSLLSGTNKGYGTKCDITEAYIWLPK